jgi:predicted dehydrogenase
MKHKVGIVGTGFGLSFHLPAFQNHPKFEVIGLCGKNVDKTQTLSNDLNIQSFENWETMVEDPSIDIISIATPPKIHFDIAKAALENKKHILLEKPTTSNSDQAQVLYNLSQSNKLIGMMAHEWRYYYPNQILHKMLNEDNLIGKIEEIRLQDLLPYAFNDRYSWEYDSEQDGGWVGIAGSHIVDLTRFLTNSEFDNVVGHTHIRQKYRKAANGASHEVTAEDAFSAIFSLANGAQGVIDHLPTLSPAPSSRLIVSATKGTIYTEGSNILIPEKIFHAENGLKFTEINLNSNPHDMSDLGIGGVMHQLFQILLDEFDSAIINKSEPSLSLFDGWKNQVVLDKIRGL